MGDSRVSRVLAFLEATEGLCVDTDILSVSCDKTLAAIPAYLAEAGQLKSALEALDATVAHAHLVAAL